ncbi:MAG: PAS domain S-box protein, partial [Epsilonproteobacteria bacterium]|nr:PAS domain S-box protein [Campylobacterota bacterium]
MDFFKFFKKGEKSDALINEKKLLESKAQAKREADIEKKLFLPKKEEEQIKQLAKIWRPKPINVEKVFGRDEIIVSKTDTQGNIIYGNSLFIKIAGYAQNEMLGQPHNIIRHPDMPKIVF